MEENKRKRGRPCGSLSKNDRVSYRVNENEKSILNDIVKYTNSNRSDISRLAVLEYYCNHIDEWRQNDNYDYDDFDYNEYDDFGYENETDEDL